jgi:hypothetical protein
MEREREKKKHRKMSKNIKNRHMKAQAGVNPLTPENLH